jgi:hypothetical protein
MKTDRGKRADPAGRKRSWQLRACGHCLSGISPKPSGNVG